MYTEDARVARGGGHVGCDRPLSSINDAFRGRPCFGTRGITKFLPTVGLKIVF